MTMVLSTTSCNIILLDKRNAKFTWFQQSLQELKCRSSSKSNLSNVNLSQLQHHVVICLDNDGKKTFADNLIFKAVERLAMAGKTVSLIIPDKAGNDFNDLLKSHGASEVKKLMSRQIRGSRLITQS